MIAIGRQRLILLDAFFLLLLKDLHDLYLLNDLLLWSRWNPGNEHPWYRAGRDQNIIMIFVAVHNFRLPSLIAAMNHL